MKSTSCNFHSLSSTSPSATRCNFRHQVRNQITLPKASHRRPTRKDHQHPMQCHEPPLVPDRSSKSSFDVVQRKMILTLICSFRGKKERHDLLEYHCWRWLSPMMLGHHGNPKASRLMLWKQKSNPGNYRGANHPWSGRHKSLAGRRGAPRLVAAGPRRANGELGKGALRAGQSSSGPTRAALHAPTTHLLGVPHHGGLRLYATNYTYRIQYVYAHVKLARKSTQKR